MATATKMRLTGILTNSYANPLANAVIKFVCTETYFGILNTVDTEYQITASGAYDFTVNYGTYTVQIRKSDDRNFSTVMSNVVVAATGPWTIEELITQQQNVQIINPDIIEQMGFLLSQAITASNLAKDWASKSEDSKVDDTEYSAKHYSIKSSKSATASASSASASASSATQAQTAKTAAEIANTNAQSAKTAAEAAKTAAETANTSAQSAKTAAAASEAAALASKNAAATSESNALASKNAAATSATSASNSASSANTSNTGAQSAKIAAETARDKAQTWADESVDVEVEPSKFSAKHWATKSSESATQANTAKVAAVAAETAAKTARDQAVSANTSAQAAKTASETARDQSVTAKNQSVTAKTESEAARDAAVAAKNLAEQAASSTSGSIIENGNVDLSSGVAPTPIIINSVKRATLWKVTVGGTVNGVQYGVGDSIVYSAQTNSYFKIDSTDSVTSVAGKTGVVTLVKADVGLGNVDNTSDVNKPVSTAQATALAAKVDKITTVNGKPLSSSITLSSTDVGAEPAGAVASGIQELKAEQDPFPIYLTEQELADSEVPFPDVWIPFNDSLQMLAGFGDYDRLYIGDKYFELPTRSVNFERATTATYVDKSGVLRTAAINEPRFEKQGLLIEGQSANLTFPSERWAASSQAAAPWVHGDADPYGFITVSGSGSPTGSEGSYKDFSAPKTDTPYTFSMDIAKSENLNVRIRAYGMGGDMGGGVDIAIAGSTVSGDKSSVTDMGSYWRIIVTRTFTGSTRLFRIYPFGANVGASGSLSYRRVQLEELPFASSYIPTNGAAVTRAADKCWIPYALNVPPLRTGAPMTIAVNADFIGLKTGSGYQGVYSESGKAANLLLRYEGATGQVRAYRNAGSHNTATVNANERYIFAMRVTEGNYVSLAINGTIYADDSSRAPNVEGISDSLQIGCGQGQGDILFGHVRDFKIWHRALSDLQVKRLK